MIDQIKRSPAEIQSKFNRPDIHVCDHSAWKIGNGVLMHEVCVYPKQDTSLKQTARVKQEGIEVTGMQVK